MSIQDEARAETAPSDTDRESLDALMFDIDVATENLLSQATTVRLGRALFDKGYRPPQPVQVEVTTREELEALPEFSIGLVSDPDGLAVAWQKCDGVLISTGGPDFPIADYNGSIPLTVLYSPPALGGGE